jgi:hypothetical protein
MAASQQANWPDTNSLKAGRNKQSHTQNTKWGMGDNYGTGIKQKVGTMRDGAGYREVPPLKLKSPPRSLA